MAYDREQDIRNVMASNEGMTYDEAAAQVDRNANLNANLTSKAGGFLGINLAQPPSGGVTKDLFNGNLEDLVKKTGAKNLKNAGDNAQISREATFGSKIGVKINETAGGFQSMTVTTDEGEKVTVEPTVAMMTPSVDGGGVKITKTSTKGTEISTLTGATSSNGFLKMMFTQGSPKGIEKVLAATGQVTPEQIKLKVSETSSNPAVAEQNVGVDNPNEKVTAKVETVTKETNKALANPFGALTNALSGAGGLDFGNLLGQLGGIIGGVLKQGGISPNTTSLTSIASSATPNTEIPADQASRNFSLNQALTSAASKLLGTQLPMPTAGGVPGEAPTVTSASGVPSSLSGVTGAVSNLFGGTSGVLGGTSFPTNALTQPNAGSFSMPSVTPPAAIPSNVIEANGNTNVSKVVSKSNATADNVKPTDEPIKVGGRKMWQGFATPASEFTYVNSPEELETELSWVYTPGTLDNGASLVAGTPLVPTAILAIRTSTCLNQDIDMLYLHNKHHEIYGPKLDKIYPSTFGRSFNAERLDGAQAHYLIRRDGSLQRGRRPDQDLFWRGAMGKFSERTIWVFLAGGLNTNFPYTGSKDQYVSAESYTAKQWETYEMFLKIAKKVNPSIEAITVDDTQDKPHTGFSGLEWSKQRFGWETLYYGENSPANRYKNKLGPLFPSEIVKLKPQKVAEPTVTPVVTKPPPPPEPEKVAEPDTGKPPEKTPEQLETNDKELKGVQKRLDEIEKEINKLTEEFKATATLPEPEYSDKRFKIRAKVNSLRDERKELEKDATKKFDDRYDSVGVAGANYRAAQAATLAAQRKYIRAKNGITLYTEEQKIAKYGSVEKFLQNIENRKKDFEAAEKAEEELKKKYEEAQQAEEEAGKR